MTTSPRRAPLTRPSVALSLKGARARNVNDHSTLHLPWQEILRFAQNDIAYDSFTNLLDSGLFCCRGLAIKGMFEDRQVF